MARWAGTPPARCPASVDIRHPVILGVVTAQTRPATVREQYQRQNWPSQTCHTMLQTRPV